MEITDNLIMDLVSFVLYFEKQVKDIDKEVIDEFLKQSLNIYCKNYQIEDQFIIVDDQKSSNFRKNESSPLSYCEKKIYVNFNECISLYNDLPLTFVKNSDYQSFFLLMLLAFNHELKHAEQEHANIESDNIKEKLTAIYLSPIIAFPATITIDLLSFSSIMKGLSSLKIGLKYKKLYKEYYEYVPYERMANIPSYQIFIKMAEILERKDLLENSQHELERICIFGYDDGKSPSEIYIKYVVNKLAKRKNGKIQKVDYDELIQEFKELSIEEKITMGLPVNEIELNDGVKRLVYNIKTDN